MLSRLIEESEKHGFWTLQAQMMTANNASRMLHETAGFREGGYLEKYGHLNGVWHDVVLLERRSENAGGTGLPTKTCD